LKSIRIPLIFVCFFYPVILLSQVWQIKGSIFDASTKKPLAFANVFLNKTTLGTVADSSGHFLIRHVPAGNYEIIGSFIGYASFRDTIEIKNGKLLEIEIKLKSEAKKLDEIIVEVKKDKEWEKNLKKFNRVFLGTGKEAKSCRIVNSYVLDFIYENGSEGKVLKANASKPLEIENLYLGYWLIYYLQDFSAIAGTFATSAYSIIGDQRFEPIKTKDSTLIHQWLNRRMETYLGSHRHLFKAIIDHRLKEEGFDLFFESEVKRDVYIPKSVSTTKLINLDPSKIKVNTLGDGRYQIELGMTEVHYSRKSQNVGTLYTTYDLEVSWLNPKKGYLIVDSNGIVINSLDMIVAGAMFEKRVASHLPHDYKPTIN
jgi:hypothetical protein